MALGQVFVKRGDMVLPQGQSVGVTYEKKDEVPTVPLYTLMMQHEPMLYVDVQRTGDFTNFGSVNFILGRESTDTIYTHAGERYFSTNFTPTKTENGGVYYPETYYKAPIAELKSTLIVILNFNRLGVKQAWRDRIDGIVDVRDSGGFHLGYREVGYKDYAAQLTVGKDQFDTDAAFVEDYETSPLKDKKIIMAVTRDASSGEVSWLRFDGEKMTKATRSLNAYISAGVDVKFIARDAKKGFPIQAVMHTNKVLTEDEFLEIAQAAAREGRVYSKTPSE